jgi:hypothetical protein
MSKVSRSPRRIVTALFGAIFAVSMWSSDAWACRGTAEYPDVAAKLAAASLPADKKADLTRQLEEGRALHDKAHQQNDTGAMRESLKILDGIKGAL